MREPWYAGYVAGKGCSTIETGKDSDRLILHMTGLPLLVFAAGC